MPYNNLGKLVVNVTSAGGALPNAEALIRINGADDENRDVVYSFLTDVDGISRTFELPAPPRERSLSPDTSLASYALYDISASLDGYYSFRISNVAVFDGETTVQPINLIPSPTRQNNTSFPRGNLVAISNENEMLE